MWDNIHSNFEGETANFGPRIEQVAGSLLYEARTVLTIGAKGDVDTNPKVQSRSSNEYFVISVDKQIHVFDDQFQIIHSWSYDSDIDIITLVGSFLIVGDREGCLHLIHITSSKVKSFPVECKSHDNQPAFLDITVSCNDNDKLSGSDHVCILLRSGELCVLTLNSNLLNESILSEDADSDNANLFSKISFEEEFENMQPKNVAIVKDLFIVTGKNGSVLSIQGEDQMSMSNNFPGNEIKKMVTTYDCRYMVVLNGSGHISLVCLVSFLVVDVWSDKEVEDFILIEYADPSGIVTKSQVAVLSRASDSSRWLEVYSCPAKELQYSLQVSEYCCLSSLVHDQEQFYIVEGITDNNSNTVSELRIKVLNEALPETKLANLINKRKFHEAEAFAKLFDLNLEDVYRQHAFFLIEELGPWKRSSVKTDTEDENLKLLMELLLNLPNKLDTAQYCVDAALSSSESTIALLNFAKALIQDEKGSEKILTQINILLNRILTFQILYTDDWMYWFEFSKASLLKKMCSHFTNEDLSSALFIWERHRDEIAPNLNEDNIEMIINSVPSTMTSEQLVKWLEGDGFLEAVLYNTPDTIEYICNWLLQKVYQMELNERNTWPSGGVKLLNIIPNVYEKLSFKTGTNSPKLKTWLALHKIPRVMKEDNSSFSSLLKLLHNMKQLTCLWNDHLCHLPLSDFCHSDKMLVVFSILDYSTTEGSTIKLLNQFLVDYMKRYDLNISSVLTEYVTDLVLSSPFTWWHWEEAPWEEKVLAITKFIEHPEDQMSAILTILMHAPVPWSNGIKLLYKKGVALEHGQNDDIVSQKKIVAVKLILNEYKLRSFNTLDSTGAEMLVKHIIYLDKQTCLTDALHIAAAYNNISEIDVYFCYLRKILFSGEADRFCETVKMLHLDILTKVGPRLSNFIVLFFEEPSASYDGHKMREIFEASIYFMELLEKILEEKETLSVGLERIHKSFILFKDYNILVPTSKLACVKDIEGVLINLCQKKFENEKSAGDSKDAPDYTGWLFRLARVLDVTVCQAAEIAIIQALNYHKINIIKCIMKCLTDVKKFHPSLLRIIKYIFLNNFPLLELANEIYAVACHTASICGIDDLEFCIRACQWAKFLTYLLEASETVDSMLLQKSDPYTVWKFSYLYQEQGLHFSREVISNTVMDFSKSYWRFVLLNETNSFTDFFNSLKKLCNNLKQKSQLEACLRFFGVVDSLSPEAPELSKYVRSGIDETIVAILLRATTQKHTDFTFMLGLLYTLNSHEAFRLLKKLVYQCGKHFGLLKALTTLGCKLACQLNVPEIRLKFENLYKRAFWGKRLSDLSISFKDALTSSSDTELQKVLQEMIANPNIDVQTLKEYCCSFDLDEDQAILKHLEYLLLDRAMKLFFDGKDLKEIIFKVEKVINCISSKDIICSLLEKCETKCDPYCYEILEFTYRHMNEMEVTLKKTFLKETKVLNFLKSYKRRGKPQDYEKDMWFMKHPEQENLPPVISTRLPFHYLIEANPWKFIDEEFYPETISIWLEMAKVLNLSQDQIRAMTVQNTISFWSGNVGSARVLDSSLLDVIQIIVKDIKEPKMALASASWVVKHLPKGPTKVEAAKRCAALAKHLIEEDPTQNKAAKAYNKLKLQHLLYATEQVLVESKLGSQNYLALCTKPESLIALLLSEAGSEGLFTEQEMVFRAIREITEISGCDITELYVSIMEKWLNLTSINDTLDQTMTFNFNLNIQLSEGMDEDDKNIVRIIHLMQYMPQDLSFEILNRIISQECGFFALQQKVSALKCLLASFCPSTVEKLMQQDYDAIFSKLQLLMYTAELQNLGFPVTFSSLDCTKAQELSESLIMAKGHNLKVLKIVFALCQEFDISKTALWNSVILNAMELGLHEDMMSMLTYLGQYPLLWHIPLFTNAWEKLLSQTMNGHSAEEKVKTLEERCKFILRCPCVNSLDLKGLIEEYKCKDYVLFSFVCSALQRNGSFCKNLRQYLLSLDENLLSDLLNFGKHLSFLHLENVLKEIEYCQEVIKHS